MTTQRLYYEDPYLTTFEAAVVERLTLEGRPAVALDRTAFYPTGGGQPHDAGALAGVAVVGVETREADGMVIHVLAGDLPGDRATGAVDWARRFDHMQHHTGQHILSAAFVTVAGASTVGFHLGVESVTIDLDRPHIAPDALDAVEDLANEVVTRNLPVRAWFPTDAELAAIALRKELAVAGKVRIVQIGDFDATGCGGTHVTHTGEVGVIKVLKLERRADTTRVEFRCGARALRDYRMKNAIVNALAAEFTVGGWEVDHAVARLKAELKATRTALNQARAQQVEYEAVALRDSATEQGGVRVIARAFENWEARDLNKLAAELVKTPRTVALLGLAGEKAQLIVARADDAPQDMTGVLKRALAVLGTDRGGGRPGYAAGGGVPASLEQVEAALAEAARALSASED
ncbi:MAG: DHHA1 domain-containing protein [Anaerolineae bacterium]|nr:DHHA1 domain-containing protein [Anaerolineae bacterium]